MFQTLEVSMLIVEEKYSTEKQTNKQNTFP